VTPAEQLERYTRDRPQEVLLVSLDIDGEADEVMVFKGFSSSLMRPTAADPDVPVIPPTARIRRVDRLEAPYRPTAPRYIQQGMTWEECQAWLRAAGIA